ncbi:MAG: HAD family hydrolase [Dysgonomonas sp.]
MESEKKTIAAFDFDGTITTKDTLFDFISFYHGRFRLFTGLIVLSPTLLMYLLKITTNDDAKQKMFSYFFKNEPADHFNEICTKYSQRIVEITNKEIIEKIKWHRQQSHVVIIISASVRNWIEPWAKSAGIEKVLATEIEVKDNTVTGKFSSKNCYGKEKVNRLSAEYPNIKDYTLYAYGDSSGDRELLETADYPTLVKK